MRSLKGNALRVVCGLLLLLLCATAAKNAAGQELAMPDEQINYTISEINGTFWAKIDGTYPISYSGSSTSIPMVYPTPPGTTNISVWLNGVKVDWSNFTEVYPNVLHHTAIGNWSMILAVLDNVSNAFVLKIHYEHPLQVINGSNVFLYDLNILEYLSAAHNKSVAHFTINMETGYSHLKICTVYGADETLKPVDFSVSDGKPTVIRIDEVSEYNEPLPGDLLVSFSKTTAYNNYQLLLGLGFIIGLTIAGSFVYLFTRKRRKQMKALNDS